MKRATHNFIFSFSSLLLFRVCTISSSPSTASAFHLRQCKFLELSFFLFIFTNICIDVFRFSYICFFPCIGGLEALFRWLTFVAPLLLPYPSSPLLALLCHSSCINLFCFSYIVWFLALFSTLSLPSWVLVGFLGLLRRYFPVCHHFRSRCRCWRSRATLHQRCLHTRLTMF